jgi:hypothetical protein
MKRTPTKTKPSGRIITTWMLTNKSKPKSKGKK